MIFSIKPIQWSVTVLLGLAWSPSATGSMAMATMAMAPYQGAQAPVTTTADTTRTLLPVDAPAASKIASSLQRVVQRMQQDGVTAANVTARHAEQYSTPLVHVDATGRVHTAILITAWEAQAESVLTAHQVTIDQVDAQAHLVQAWIPFDRLTTIAALPFVRYLRPPSYAHRR